MIKLKRDKKQVIDNLCLVTFNSDVHSIRYLHLIMILSSSIFFSTQLWVTKQGRLGILALDGNGSKEICREDSEKPKKGDNSQIIKKLLKAMISYVSK